jgi:cysteinyl-tRNA synthetase
MGADKMSKSLGNVKLIHDLLKDWDGEVIRLALLKAHYRSELIWSEDLLKESKAQLDGWYRVLQKNNYQADTRRDPNEVLHRTIFEDLGTPSSIREISEFGDFLSKQATEANIYAEDAVLMIEIFGDLLGLLQKDPDDWFAGGLDKAKYDRLAQEYDVARADAIAAKRAGDKARMGDLFARSDTIRDELKAEGVILETGPEGSTWRKS